MGVGGSPRPHQTTPIYGPVWEFVRESFEIMVWSIRVVDVVVTHYEILNIRTNTTSFARISITVRQLISRYRNNLQEKRVVIKPCFTMLQHRGYRNNIERQNSLKEEVMHCVLRRIIDQWLPLASRAKYLNFNNENLKLWLSERLCGIIIVGNIIFAGSLVVVVEDVIHNIISTIIFWITNYH